MPLAIRPHHALCIRFFKGHGYSPEFTRSMQAVIARLNAGEEVFLTEGMDSVCSCCPNNQGGVCTSQEKVLSYDKGVLEKSRLPLNKSLTWKNIQNSVQEKIITPAEVFESICADCQWAALCHTD